MSERQYSSSGLYRGDKPVTDWPSIRSWVLRRDNNTCQLCSVRPATDVDHIWPRRLGGEDRIDNLRAACGPCNKAKGDRVCLESASWLRLYVAERTLSKRIEDLENERNSFVMALFVRRFRDGKDLADQAAQRARDLMLRSLDLKDEAEIWEAVARRASPPDSEPTPPEPPTPAAPVLQIVRAA